jgi:hypothetical protein
VKTLVTRRPLIMNCGIEGSGSREGDVPVDVAVELDAIFTASQSGHLCFKRSVAASAQPGGSVETPSRSICWNVSAVGDIE